jgi:hypothetical protein
MMNLLELVENLREKIAIPKYFDHLSQRTVWVMGRNYGAAIVRSHVRHNSAAPLPWLTKAPKGVEEEMGPELAKVWLDGYNTSIRYVETYVNRALFHATDTRKVIRR